MAVKKKAKKKAKKETTSSSYKRFYTDTAAIALITGISYLLGFTYEAGAANYYGYPFSLIKVDLNIILVSAAFIFLAFVTSTMVFNLAKPMFNKLPAPIRTLLLLASAAIYILFVKLVIVGESFADVFPLLIFVVAIISPIIIDAIYSMKKDREPFLSSLDKAVGRELSRPTPITPLRKYIGFRPFLIILFSYFFLHFTFYVGFLSAKVKNSYSVIHSEPNKPILRIYSDFMIVGDYDLSTNQLSGKYQTIPISISKKEQRVFIEKYTGSLWRDRSILKKKEQDKNTKDEDSSNSIIAKMKQRIVDVVKNIFSEND